MLLQIKPISTRITARSAGSDRIVFFADRKITTILIPAPAPRMINGNHISGVQKYRTYHTRSKRYAIRVRKKLRKQSPLRDVHLISPIQQTESLNPDTAYVRSHKRKKNVSFPVPPVLIRYQLLPPLTQSITPPRAHRNAPKNNTAGYRLTYTNSSRNLRNILRKKITP